MNGAAKAQNAVPLHLQNCWRAGWEDRRQALPWPREYDGWDQFMQRNYENGRLSASNVIGAGMTPVQYVQHAKAGKGLFALPDAVLHQHIRACEKLGGLPWAKNRATIAVPLAKPKLSAALLGL